MQKAEPHSVYAKIEWERRASARRDAREGETLSIARRALASSEWANRIATIAIICSVITAIVVAIMCKAPRTGVSLARQSPDV